MDSSEEDFVLPLLAEEAATIPKKNITFRSKHTIMCTYSRISDQHNHLSHAAR